jgi:hypothetical protein
LLDAVARLRIVSVLLRQPTAANPNHVKNMDVMSLSIRIQSHDAWEDFGIANMDLYPVLVDGLSLAN